MQRLLVTGASGFLGWNLCRVAQSQGWDVYGTYHSQAIAIANVQLAKLNLLDFASLQQIMADVRPDAVIHTAAQARPNACQQHPIATHAINVAASLTLAELCAAEQIPFVFTSTDLVFDGLHPPYAEGDRVCPVNSYGEQKVAAEQGILARYPQAIVCRMPLMFGAAPPTATSFIQPFIATLRQGKPLNLFMDEVRTPVSGTAAAQGLLIALATPGGLLHLGGKERLTRYEFGCIMAEILQLPAALITACAQASVPTIAPRSIDTSLNSDKAFALGYAPPSVREELQQLRGQI